MGTYDAHAAGIGALEPQTVRGRGLNGELMACAVAIWLSRWRLICVCPR